MTGCGAREGNPQSSPRENDRWTDFRGTDFGGATNPQLPVARENAPLLPDTPEVNAGTEVFSLEKFVFLCLGIGHKYCE